MWPEQQLYRVVQKATIFSLFSHYNRVFGRPPSSTDFYFFALGPSDLGCTSIGTPCSSKSSHNSFLHLFFTMLAPLLWSFFSVVTVVSTTVPKRNREKRDPIQKLYCFYSSLLKTCIIEQTGTLFSKSILGLFVTF